MLENTLLAFVTIAGIVMFFSLLILRLTIDRRVRRSLPSTKIYENYPDWYFGFGRSIVFAYAAILERANNSVVMKSFYDGFDIKNFVNTVEKSIAYCFCISLFVLSFGSIFYMVLGWFGFVNIE